MANKQPGLDKIFSKTEPKSAAKKADKPNPLGVALEQETINKLTRIAKALGVYRHSVMQYAIKDFIRRYDAGERPEVETKTVEVKKLKM